MGWFAGSRSAGTWQARWRKRWHRPKQVSLAGPLVTSQGFVLILVEERQPPALDPATRLHIENELFAAWVLDRIREARIDLSLMGTF